MQEQNTWQFIQKKLLLGLKLAFMLVPESKGSSPGRQGHQMAVAEDGEMVGTIGGGAMEFIQVENCKKQFLAGQKPLIWQRLVHDKTDKNQWSGLSCSGEQIVLTFFLEQQHLSLVETILKSMANGEKCNLIVNSKNEFQLTPIIENETPYTYYFDTPENWYYRMLLGAKSIVYLIGAGHVGLALCKQLYLLDFQVVLIDNRPELPTQNYTQFISKKIITPYKNVAEFVPSTKNDYIVIMSFSSALDALILEQLIHKPCSYIGMMASQTKADRIRAQFLEKGISEEDFNKVHTPIGLPIKCKTPAEIAVSVAAQMINIKNNFEF